MSFSKKFLVSAVVVVALAVVFGIGAFRLMERLSGKQFLPETKTITKTEENQRVVNEENVIIEVVKKVSPSVVSIAVERRLLNPFEQFSAPSSEESGIGTGFVLDEGGLILTNKHVVSQDQKYFVLVKQDDGSDKKYEVSQINRDPFNDLAILKIDASGLKPVELGDSSKLQVGQVAIAIGNALGRLENTVTTGVISGLGRGISPVDPTTGIAEQLSDVIQTDAAINPGNSGGPLLNSAGQVIGVNVAVASAENIGFALPINTAKQLYDDFRQAGGRISRPFLGIQYRHVSRDVAILNDVPEGEYILEIVSGSAAEKVGLRVGDIITKIDGEKLTEEKGLSQIIRTKKVGDKMNLTVWRDNKNLELQITLGEAGNS